MTFLPSNSPSKFLRNFLLCAREIPNIFYFFWNCLPVSEKWILLLSNCLVLPSTLFFSFPWCRGQPLQWQKQKALPHLLCFFSFFSSTTTPSFLLTNGQPNLFFFLLISFLPVREKPLCVLCLMAFYSPSLEGSSRRCRLLAHGNNKLALHGEDKWWAGACKGCRLLFVSAEGDGDVNIRWCTAWSGSRQEKKGWQ